MGLRERAEAAKARAEAATRGPWRQEFAYNNGGCPTADFFIPGHNGGASVEMLQGDAAFIAAAREDVPALADAVLRMTGAEMRERVGTWLLLLVAEDRCKTLGDCAREAESLMALLTGQAGGEG